MGGAEPQHAISNNNKVNEQEAEGEKQEKKGTD